MIRPTIFAASLLALACAPASAKGEGSLTPEEINYLDQHGYFSASFKSAIHDLVESKTAVQDMTEEQKKLAHDLPGLQQKAAEAGAKTVALRQELAQYDHPEDNDFTVLQERVRDPNAALQDQIALAQAYVWTYPMSPHEAEAAQVLARLQKKSADDEEARRRSAADNAAAHAALVARAQAHDLSLDEWRGFLRGMSQEDLVKLLGPPSSQRDGYWFYNGEWLVNPALGRKVGLQVNFDAGRVITVDAKPPQP
jgi:hypothetical protein